MTEIIAFIKNFLLVIVLILFAISCIDPDKNEYDSMDNLDSKRNELTDAERNSLIKAFYEKYNIRCVDKLIYYNGQEVSGFESFKAFGPPLGEGEYGGAMDVFVIGEGGKAIFATESYMLENGQGIDFKIFENGFRTKENPELNAWDLGTVEVSSDLENWYGFEPKHDKILNNQWTAGKQNLVGLNPVTVNYRTNAMDPRLSEAGGDAFDLDDAKLILDRRDGDPVNFIYGNTLAEDNIGKVKYFKISDGGQFLPDEQAFSNGLDIDAICLFYPLHTAIY